MENISSFSILTSGPWKARFQIIGIWICGFGVLASAGWSIWQLILIQFNLAHTPVDVVTILPPAEPYVLAYELKEFTFPIFSKSKNRILYGRFSLVLDCRTQESRGVFEKGKARVLDAVVNVTASYYYEDFETPAGFDRLKRDLLAAISKRFPGFEPRQLLLTDWTIG